MKDVMKKKAVDIITTTFITPQAVAAALYLLDFGVQLEELEEVITEWSLDEVPEPFRIQVLKEYKNIQGSLRV